MPTTSALLAAASGLALGLGLIVAIGAQNAFVLRQGLRLEHVAAAAVVAVCALSDLALIIAGVLGAGSVLSRVPWLIPVVCFAGAAFLLVYGAMAARRGLRPGTLVSEAAGASAGLTATVGTGLALTWLNPHVYLDTVVPARLDGLHLRRAPVAVRRRRGSGQRRLVHRPGFGARLLRPVFARPAAWRVLDGVIAVVMSVLAVSLAIRGLSLLR